MLGQNEIDAVTKVIKSGMLAAGPEVKPSSKSLLNMLVVGLHVPSTTAQPH